jgi:hypothetical protein
MQFTNFATRNKNQIEIIIDYNNETIPICSSTKFLGLTVDCTLTWITHIDSVTKNLITICYLIRNIKLYLSISMLRKIYHSLFYSIISYGIIFWGNSSHSSVIFKIQKTVIRTMMGCGCRESYRKLFVELKILLLASKYIGIFRCALYIRCAVSIQQVRENEKIRGARYTSGARYRRENTVLSLLLFVVNNRNYFIPNSAYHDSTVIRDIGMTYTYPRQHWPCIRKEFIIRP